MTINNFYGLLITINNHTIFEQYVNNNKNTKFRIFSCSKPITGLAIILLLQMKLLNLHDTLNKFNINIPNNNNITIYHLLQHTSGIYDFISRFYFDLTPIDLFNNITHDFSTDFIDFNTIIHHINKNLYIPSNFNKFIYNNTSYDILGYIIYIVTGMYSHDFITQYIFIPLKMYNSNFQYNFDPNESIPFDNSKKIAIKEQQNWFSGNAFVVCTLRDLNIFITNYHILLNHYHLNLYENLYYFKPMFFKQNILKSMSHEGGGDFSYLHSINKEKYISLSKSFFIKFTDSYNNIITVIISENFRYNHGGFFANNKFILKKIINVILQYFY